MLPLRAAALTDIGRVRRQNEDRFICNEKELIFGIADGVGGLPGGAEAAQHAIELISAGIIAGPLASDADLVALVHRTNEAVATLGQKVSASTGIATTLTIGYIRENVLKIAHVGDSRAFGISHDAFSQLTEDHSVENEARQRRALGESAYYHPANRNALTRCMGQPTPPGVDLVTRLLEAGDRYLFCTDGVTRLVSNGEISDIMKKSSGPAAAVNELVALALRRGGPDNATAVVIFIDSV